MPSRRDGLTCLGIGILGALLGIIVLVTSGYLYFYQFFSPEVVYAACGLGLSHPGEIPPDMLAFLSYKTSSFNCASLPDVGTLGPAGFFTQAHLYLMWLVAGLWRISSISYINLWPLIGALYGAYAAGCYALLRLFFPRVSSVVGALVLLLSPVALTMVLYVRDFAKAPFFVWALVLIILTIRARDRQAKCIRLAASAGAVIGLGYGFRSDVIVLLPVGLLVLFFGIGPKMIWRRLSASALFAGMVLLFAWPMLSATGGSGTGAMLLEGATDPFNVYMELEGAPYSLGAHYSDEFTLSSIAADLRAASPAWDANESLPVYGITQAMTRSSSYVTDRLAFMIGDIATRALKSAAWILGYPAIVEPQRLAMDPGGLVRGGGRLGRLIYAPYDLIAQPWLPLIGIVGFLAFILREASVRPREAVVLTSAFGILLGYTALQFSTRHTFHLEFFWVLAILSIIHASLEVSRLRPVFPQFLTAVIGLAALLFVAHAGLVSYQSQSIHAALDALLYGSKVDVTLNSAANGDERLFSVPVPERFRPLISTSPDSMVSGPLPVGVQWNVRAAANRLLLTFGGKNCTPGSMKITMKYAKQMAWQPLDQTISLDVGASEPTYVLVPVFYRPTQYFSAIGVPESNAACLTAIEELTASTKLPMAFSAVLKPGWKEQSMSLGFGGFGMPSS